jgi:hypothetical protein
MYAQNRTTRLPSVFFTILHLALNLKFICCREKNLVVGQSTFIFPTSHSFYNLTDTYLPELNSFLYFNTLLDLLSVC